MQLCWDARMGCGRMQGNARFFLVSEIDAGFPVHFKDAIN
jgi:hypothetical protein